MAAEALAFPPDGDQLAVAGDGGISLLDAATGQVILDDPGFG